MNSPNFKTKIGKTRLPELQLLLKNAIASFSPLANIYGVYFAQRLHQLSFKYSSKNVKMVLFIFRVTVIFQHCKIFRRKWLSVTTRSILLSTWFTCKLQNTFLTKHSLRKIKATYSRNLLKLST